MAGANASARLIVPSDSSSTSQPCTVPGTDIDSGPKAGIRLWPLACRSSIDAARGARPLPFNAVTFRPAAFHISANTSPPTPVDMGSTTFSVAAVVTAASTALPPSIRTRRPAIAASGWLVATIPWVACIVERRELKNMVIAPGLGGGQFSTAPETWECGPL